MRCCEFAMFRCVFETKFLWICWWEFLGSQDLFINYSEWLFSSTEQTISQISQICKFIVNTVYSVYYTELLLAWVCIIFHIFNWAAKHKSDFPVEFHGFVWSWSSFICGIFRKIEYSLCFSVFSVFQFFGKINSESFNVGNQWWIRNTTSLLYLITFAYFLP